jgi:dihydrofolate reductase
MNPCLKDGTRRRMFDVGIAHWGPDGAFERPTIMVIRRAREDLVRGASTLHFETGGIKAALQRAPGIAGERDVVVAGGAALARQSLTLGLIDELRLHVVPVMLGGGAPLYGDGHLAEWQLVSSQSTCNALHLVYCRRAARALVADQRSPGDGWVQSSGEAGSA